MTKNHISNVFERDTKSVDIKWEQLKNKPTEPNGNSDTDSIRKDNYTVSEIFEHDKTWVWTQRKPYKEVDRVKQVMLLPDIELNVVIVESYHGLKYSDLTDFWLSPWVLSLKKIELVLRCGEKSSQEIKILFSDSLLRSKWLFLVTGNVSKIQHSRAI